jgi:outer membrane protein assembly factor BamB
VVKLGSNGLFPKDNGIEIINLANGNVLREIAIPKKSSMTPTVFDKDKILIVDQEGTFLFINGTTGAIEAEVRTNAIQPIGLAVTVVKDKAFTAGRNGTVICMDLSNRTLVWEKSLLAERKISVSNDLETGAGELYAYSNLTLYALSQSTGEAIFPPVSGLSGPPLYFGGSLYYGTVDKKLVIASAKTGRIANSIELDQKITAKPVFGAGGTIFVGTNSGAVYELDPGVFR